MLHYLPIEDFLQQSKIGIMLDVRTPAEYQQGHIPNTFNIPLFSNEDRVKVGTCYKQIGKKQAILLGFELIGGNWANFIRQTDVLFEKENTKPLPKKVFIYCWRGGMRSAAMAWALQMGGYEVVLLKGGYKSYRKLCLQTFNAPYPIIVLSGKTGSAKTELLAALKVLGEQVIDLEELANHQGSSFGSMGKNIQPSQEHFENLLCAELLSLSKEKEVWMENESILIGRNKIPEGIFTQMRETAIVDIEIPYQQRVSLLVEKYGCLDPLFLRESVLKISKRLGPNETKLSIQALDENRIEDFIKQVLVYYDKRYEKGQMLRAPEKINRLALHSDDFKVNAITILQYRQNLKH